VCILKTERSKKLFLIELKSTIESCDDKKSGIAIHEDDMERYLHNEVKIRERKEEAYIDRLVSFYRAAVRLDRIFVVDSYIANIPYELRRLGNNHLPYPSVYCPNIKVLKLSQVILKF